jgi:hypothetical protein
VDKLLRLAIADIFFIGGRWPSGTKAKSTDVRSYVGFWGKADSAFNGMVADHVHHRFVSDFLGPQCCPTARRVIHMRFHILVRSVYKNAVLPDADAPQKGDF